MPDWKKIAEARGIAIPAEEMTRSAASLDALEQSFRPLARAIPDDVEPAITFRAEENE